MHKSNILRMMEDAVLKAGKSLARDFGELEHLQVSKKGQGDFVTSADHRAEEILMEELRKVRPKYGFLVEESGEVKGEDEQFRWIADPLDGTHNFMHGVPHFCVSLALEELTVSGKRDIIAGITYVPTSGEFFWAEKGVGAFHNSRRLMVSSRKKFEEALLGSSLVRSEGKRSAAEIDQVCSKGANLRIFGAAALELAYVAAGKLDGFWHRRLQPWDLAVGILLVREARGMVTEIGGGSNILENGNILATNGALHEEIDSMLATDYSSGL